MQRFRHPKEKARDLKVEWEKTLRVDIAHNGKKKSHQR